MLNSHLFVFLALLSCCECFTFANNSTINVTKWASPGQLPRHYQRDRGTCWIFSTVGFLEDSYINNGYRKNFLQPNEYVDFSDQAFGISMMAACKKHPDVCTEVIGTETTEGGDVYWLYSLGEVYSKVLPVSVCPYPDSPSWENEHSCPDYEKAIKVNPIRFNITDMITSYGAFQSKQLMIEKQSALAWVTLMHNSYFYYPCSDPDWSTKSGCDDNHAVTCPMDKYYNSKKCAVYVASMFNQDGEFFAQGNIVTEGGHGMVAVGFNDHFVTKKGYKGGFILKNSWEDRTYGSNPSGRGARGSHSIKYWLQEISGWAERKICPNVLNPNNWLSCVLQEPGITFSYKKYSTIDPLEDYYDISRTCLDDAFLNKLTDEQFQATEFQCLDETFCSTNRSLRYFFIRNMRSADGDTMQLAMLEHNTIDASQRVIVTPYMQDSAIAYIFAPIQSQQEKLPNSELCGYYFWPYELNEKQNGLFGEFSTVYFDVHWDDSSYLVNRAKYPQYDYSYLKSSSGILPVYEPICQNPWATTRFF